jgi:hypothetical protein
LEREKKEKRSLFQGGNVKLLHRLLGIDSGSQVGVHYLVFSVFAVTSVLANVLGAVYVHDVLCIKVVSS